MNLIVWTLLSIFGLYLMITFTRKLKEYLRINIHKIRFPKDKGRHQWTFIQDLENHLCSFCFKQIDGMISGVICEICGISAHAFCSRSHSVKCKKVHSQHLLEDNDHQWIHTLLPLESICSYCKTYCVDYYNSKGFQCLWCQRIAHKVCKEGKDNIICDYGTFNNVIIRPSYITYTAGNRIKELKNKVGNLLKIKKKIRRSNSSIIGDTWAFKVPEHLNPVIVCVNRKSGGQIGSRILSLFYKNLNPVQVIDLINEGLEQIDKFIFGLKKYVILVAGGDGSVASVCTYLYDKIASFPGLYIPPIAILPLGVGNDLSIVLGWGKGFEENNPCSVLKEIEKNTIPSILDTWNVKISKEGKNSLNQKVIKKESRIMYNYMGFGVDAKVSSTFHEMRNKCPGFFFCNRFTNKVLYSQLGLLQIASSPRQFSNELRLYCDEKEIEIENIVGIVVLNISSQGGKADYWDNPSVSQGIFKVQNISDGILEVIGVCDIFHLGKCMIGMDHGIRLCQGKHIQVEIISNHDFSVQIDGEPFVFQKGKTQIEFALKNQIQVLKHLEEDSTNAEKKCFEVLEAAMNNKQITPEQFNYLKLEIAKKLNEIPKIV